MYKRILLCYDGSREGRHALRAGAELAIQLKAETHVLAVQDSVSQALVPEAFTETLVRAAEGHARQILDEGVAWLLERGLKAEGHLVFGHPAEHIARIARQLDVDLVVIGHKPQGMLARWWTRGATTAYSLLDELHCSVHIAMVADAQD